jgi:leucyl-tRNA synthetase
MEMFNLIKDFLDLESKRIESVNKVRLFSVFVRVLKIVAPELSSELQMKLMAKYGDLIKKEEFERWPSDELFGEKIEIFVMKGKKMVAKETVDIGSTDEQISKELNLEGKVQ